MGRVLCDTFRPPEGHIVAEEKAGTEVDVVHTVFDQALAQEDDVGLGLPVVDFQRDDVAELVGEDVGDPLLPAAEHIVKRGGPNRYPVHAVCRPTVGVFFHVADDDVDFFFQGIVKQARHLGVGDLGVFGHHAGRPLHFWVVMNHEVFGF